MVKYIRMVKLITTDSYFNVFSVLTEELKNANGLGNGKNLVFCEEKASLMTERRICGKFGGRFNTEVYSFGNFLRARVKNDNLLTKEGSAMAVRKVLSSTELNCLKSSKTGLAPSLFDLIVMLKSARVTPSDVARAAENTDGVLKSKLSDVSKAFAAYEEFIKSKGFLDQSSYLTLLPELIYNSEEVKNADVFLVGFTGGFTRQALEIVSALLVRARNVTGIFVSGDNKYAYLNESAEKFGKLCGELKLPVIKSRVKSEFSEEGKILIDKLFDPVAKTEKPKETEKIKLFAAKSKREEMLSVAEEIKKKVLAGARYKDFSVAVPDPAGYADDIEWAFDLLDLPYFLDRKKKADCHPLVTLISDYCDALRKNLKREYVIKLAENPLVCGDKKLADDFCEYIIKYNVDYSAIKKPFTFETGEEGFAEKENLRVLLCDVLEKFDVRRLLNKLSVSEKLAEFSLDLTQRGFKEESAVNDQVYGYITSILDEMDRIAYEPEDVSVFKAVFRSGVSALELSLIPQYNDAVFIGDFKETALAKAKNLFAVGLTEQVPRLREDVAILSDSDIDKLEESEVDLEPKIDVVNRREKENVAACLSSFSETLYLSYPLFSAGGDLNEKSEVVKTAEKLFTAKKFGERDGYLTYREGLHTFAAVCGEYSKNYRADIDDMNAFYACDADGNADYFLAVSGKKITEKIDDAKLLFKGETSPTALENFFKCPFVAFMQNGLKLKENVKSEMDYAEIGSVMHKVFEEYSKRIGKITDKAYSDMEIERIKSEILEDSENGRHLSSSRGEYLLNAIFDECKEFCYKNYSAYSDSDFKFARAEVAFGEGKEKTGGFPAVSLADGDIKLKGVIDRIDVFVSPDGTKYCRIVDYKTGKREVRDRDLFTGVKLQLFLYAAAVKGYRIAGVYYMPVLDRFLKKGETPALTVGKTVNEEELLYAQDRKFATTGKGDFINGANTGRNGGLVKEEELSAYLKYALKVCERGAKEMLDGYIKPSPAAGECEYCPYFSVCGNDGKERSVGSVSAKTIAESVEERTVGEKEDAES